jgi:hypothetical protein
VKSFTVFFSPLDFEAKKQTKPEKEINFIVIAEHFSGILLEVLED